MEAIFRVIILPFFLRATTVGAAYDQRICQYHLLKLAGTDLSSLQLKRVGLSMAERGSLFAGREAVRRAEVVSPCNVNQLRRKL